MANNSSQATLDKGYFMTKTQRQLIRASGGDYEAKTGHDSPVYAFWEESWDDNWDNWLEAIDQNVEQGTEEFAALEAKITGWSLPDLLRDVLLNPENAGEESIRFECAFTCSKMRPGEFGGCALLVTRTQYCWINTSMLSVKDGQIATPEVNVYSF